MMIALAGLMNATFYIARALSVSLLFTVEQEYYSKWPSGWSGCSTHERKGMNRALALDAGKVTFKRAADASFWPITVEREIRWCCYSYKGISWMNVV